MSSDIRICSDYFRKDFQAFNPVCEYVRMNKTLSPKEFDEFMQKPPQYAIDILYENHCDGLSVCHIAAFHNNYKLITHIAKLSKRILNLGCARGGSTLIYEVIVDFDDLISRQGDNFYKCEEVFPKLELLITLGCDLNIATIAERRCREEDYEPKNITPLWFPVNSGNIKLTKFLLRHGAIPQRDIYANQRPGITICKKDRTPESIERRLNTLKQAEMEILEEDYPEEMRNYLLRERDYFTCSLHLMNGEINGFLSSLAAI